MSDELPAALLSSIAELARRAGDKILEVYGQPQQVTRKSDASPLTIADLRAHKVIMDGLESITPHVPVLSEEASDIPFEVRRTWSRYWLVDPLDGTKEFLSRNGEFTVNIALIDQHVPILGVVYLPTRHTVYMGSRTGGAFRQIAEQSAVPIHVCDSPPPTLRVVGSRSHRGPDEDKYLSRLEPYELVGVGSSLKFCLIAEGSADFYPRFGPTSEWDTAAAQAVVNAAGGAVIDIDGTPLRYNTRESLLNPHFLVFGDRTRNWRKVLGLADSADPDAS
jgi:3'(2'), 5'-bisphosphate nucleotidase